MAARGLCRRSGDLAAARGEGRRRRRSSISGRPIGSAAASPINLASAKSWFERAAANGHLDAQTTLGLLLFQNGDQAERPQWLKRAAEQGEPRALLVYGTALYNGDGVTQDPMLGYGYVSRAAAQGLAPAEIRWLSSTS